MYLQTGDGQTLSAQDWLRAEWQRSGLPLYKANSACGVKNAATRKYLTSDWLWYWPSGNAVKAMADYCEKFGKMPDVPYFSLDGASPVSPDAWDGLRAVWNHRNGITNVWNRQPLASNERVRGSLKKSVPRVCRPTKQSSTHLNQKPLDLIINEIYATTNHGAIVWEPFGGLASATVSAILLGRYGYVAEIDETFAQIAKERLDEATESYNKNGLLHV